MPLPKPKPDEKKEEFVNRCMADEIMVGEFPDEKQRVAVCNSLWGAKRADDMEMETRNFELRLAGSDTEPILTGYAAVFNQDSRGLPFTERIRPGAFRSSLAGGQDILALVDHDQSKVIGRTSNGTLALREDDKGLLVEIMPNLETSFGKDVVASVQRRDITNMSIGFVCRKDAWMNDIREVLEADLKEVSVVSMAAYPQTIIDKRSVENVDQKERELRQKLAGLKEQQAALLSKETLTDEERGQVLDMTKEIRTLENQLETFKTEPKPAAPVVVTSPGIDEQRAAFVNYLRGREYDVRALVEGTPTAGGYLAPESFLAEVIRALNERSVMRGLARTITIGASSVKIPRLTSGITAAWTAETVAIAESQPAFDQVEFTPYKLAALTLVSNELLADSAVAIESFLAGLFAEKLAEVEDLAFLKGTGSGQPTGLLNGTTITRKTAADDLTITADEIIDLYDLVPPQYRGNAVWIMNPATMNYLRKLKDPGTGQYLIISGLTGAAPNTLLGRPVVLSSNVDTIAAEKDVIIFGDLARTYYIVDRQGLEVQRSTDRYFEQDLTAFRCIKRVDGKVVLPDACRILKMHATI